MKVTQNDKIMQVTSETLVVGVDIGGSTHFARAFDFRGFELVKKVIQFNNSREGFEAFHEWIVDLANKHEKNKVIVGFEPTGHYWFSLGDFLKANKLEMAVVNPYHVKRSKELDDNNPSKSDRKDPKTIAMLVKDGRFLVPYLPEGVYRELRDTMEHRGRLVRRLTDINNRVKRWIHIRFPEFFKVFKKWTGKAALITLQAFPTPDQILKTGIDGIVEAWRKEIKRAVGYKHAKRLIEAAHTTIGLTDGLAGAKLEIQCLLDDYESVMKKLEDTDLLVKDLVSQVPNAEKLYAIKGVGMTAIANFIAAVGNIQRFDDAKQIQKLFGLNIRENSSGKHKGQTTITKRGRSDGRKGLFQVALVLSAINPEFRELHKYYKNREKNPLKKMQSLVVLCNKIIRIFFALLKTGSTYDSGKMRNDIKRPVNKAA